MSADTLRNAWRWMARARLYALLPLLIVLLAAGLRFHLIGNQSLWNDEGNTLRLVERPLYTLVDAASRDIHPPGYYLLLKGWHALTGDTEFALRAFSAFAGVLTVACVYALGKTLFAPGAGALAALLVAINAFNVYYSQEARMYALMQLVSVASLWAFVVWVRELSALRVVRGRRVTGSAYAGAYFALAALNAAGLYVHYAYPFVIAAQWIAFLLWVLRQQNGPKLIQEYVILNLLTLGMFLPQLQTAFSQLTAWPRTGQPVDLAEGLATIVRWLLYGNTFGVPGEPVPAWAYGWPALFAVAGLLPDWLRRARLPGWWRQAFPVIGLVVIVGAFLALGLFREANLKFLLPAQPLLALLIGRGIWMLWEIGSPNLVVLLEAVPRLAAVFGLIAMLGFAGGALDNLYHDPAFFRDDYRSMARLIAADSQPGDAIVLNAPNQEEVFTYYYQGETPIYPLPRGLGGNDAQTAAETLDMIGRHQRLFALYWGEGERDPNRVVERTLASYAFEVSTNWYGDVRLVRYAVPGDQGALSPIGARFGESITLVEASLSSETLAPGEVLGVTLVWQTETPLARRYRVTVQLLDQEGRLVTQRDAEPGNNMALTTTWRPAEPVRDAHGLLIPATLAAGEYRVIVALYDIDDPMARLPVDGDDHIVLGTILVR
jgi:mannosyltransferase